MNLFTEQKQTYRYQKQTHAYQKGNKAGRGKLGAWDEQAHTAVYKIDNEQEPTVWHGELYLDVLQ